MRVVADHPWVGVGPGAFGTVISDYARVTLGYRLPPDNAQNWWRQQLADFGLIGGAGALLCSLLALLAVLRTWRRSPDAATVSPSAAGGPRADGHGQPAHTASRCCRCSWDCWLPTRWRPPVVADTATPAPMRWPAQLVWTVAIACAVGLAAEGWTDFRPPRRAARFHFLYYYGLSAPVEAPFGGGRWSARRSVAVLEPTGKTIVVHVVLPHEDLASAPVTVTVSDANREVCQLVARDHTKLECLVPVPDGPWPMVRLDISRAWRTVDGIEQAAMVAGRFDP